MNSFFLDDNYFAETDMDASMDQRALEHEIHAEETDFDRCLPQINVAEEHRRSVQQITQTGRAQGEAQDQLRRTVNSLITGNRSGMIEPLENWKSELVALSASAETDFAH